MGKINRGAGILGGFSGTVGTVVGSEWRGIETMRAVPKPRKGKPTAAQLDQQAKFSVGTKFISARKRLLEIGFKNFAVQMTGTNSALSHTLKNAISGVYPNYTLDYSKVLISMGGLQPAQNAVAVAGPAGVVAFSWYDNSLSDRANATDTAVMVAFCEALDASIFMMTGPQRSAAAGTLAVAGFSGKTVQTWLAFLSADGKTISNSLFAGQVNVL